jgi:spore coat polysaccharide biosynthesis protein SpsF
MTIVRLTSDCPLIDAEILTQVIQYYHAHHFDYAANILERTFPRGLDCEVFSFFALERAYRNAQTNFEKEHVTTYIHTTQKNEFSIGSFVYPKNVSRFRLTLDEPDDYKVIQEVYQQFGCRTDFTFEMLIEMLERKPYIHELNAHVEQKKS